MLFSVPEFDGIVCIQTNGTPAHFGREIQSDPCENLFLDFLPQWFRLNDDAVEVKYTALIIGRSLHVGNTNNIRKTPAAVTSAPAPYPVLPWAVHDTCP